jgi:serine/threonine protein kinase
MNEEKISIIMRQILEGLAYLKNSGFTHGNLEPENILMT